MMKKNPISRTFWVAGLLFMMAAGAAYWIESRRPRIWVEQPEREFTDARPMEERTIVFRIHNPTGRVARVVGMGSC